MRTMRLGSACSGIGCIDLGLERAGFEPAWQIEIDPTCRAVLERHWPTVERFHDLKDAARSELPPVDLIAGGTPCQDLSVAGKGAGLDGERSGLFFDFIRLADSQPWAFVLWENVAGALSSGGGADFALCLEGFTGLRFEVPPDGWRNSGVAFGPLRWCSWRLLDAQHFGVAQRRRRLWVVAGPRGRCGPEILLERESVRRDPATGGEARARVAGVTGRSTALDRGISCTLRGDRRPDEAEKGNVVVGPLMSQVGAHGRGGIDNHQADSGQIVTSLIAGRGRGDHDGQYSQLVCHTLRGEGHDASEDGSSRGTPLVVDQVQIRPRRLTPREAERLQGLPDDHTRWRSDGSAIADGPRYRMIGNGAAVPNVEWIGQRIAKAIGEAVREQPHEGRA